MFPFSLLNPPDTGETQGPAVRTYTLQTEIYNRDTEIYVVYEYIRYRFYVVLLFLTMLDLENTAEFQR